MRVTANEEREIEREKRVILCGFKHFNVRKTKIFRFLSNKNSIFDTLEFLRSVYRADVISIFFILLTQICKYSKLLNFLNIIHHADSFAEAILFIQMSILYFFNVIHLFLIIKSRTVSIKFILYANYILSKYNEKKILISEYFSLSMKTLF